MNFDIPLRIETAHRKLGSSKPSLAAIMFPRPSDKHYVASPANHCPTPDSESGKKPGKLLFGLYADEPELMRRIAEDSRTARDSEMVNGDGG